MMKRLVPKRFAKTRQFLDDHGGLISFIAVVIVAVWGVWSTHQLANDNRAAVKLALRSLCDQRHSYEQQLVDTQQYLKAHPKGAPAIGFSRAAIVNQEHSLKLRLMAYDDLNCPPTIPPTTGHK